ncbi:hypothetical protein [Plantactinospora sp. GCM10030261]|uniref:hypothetical protein n=1 Tax=Plantactinospora sp. GCM10030261 TaxID=3273420 RepID=UPI00361EFAEA
MTPEDLERALRDTLSRQAARLPHPVDPAGTALRRGRRGRRRQVILGVATTAVATLLASSAVFGLGSPSAPGPAVIIVGDPPTETERPITDAERLILAPTDLPSVTPPPTPTAEPLGPPQVDLVVDRHLATADGLRIELPADGRVTTAHRTAGGWLVATARPAGRTNLWYVTRSEPPRPVLSGLDRLVLAPDGQRAAWRTGGTLYAGTLAGAQFANPVRATVLADTDPVGFVGLAVLLRRGSAGGYDVWTPMVGAHRPAWNRELVAVYGALPDGQTVVAAVTVPNHRRPCLALLDNGADLSRIATSCDVPVSATTGSVSPDGRWLLTNIDPERPMAHQRGTTAMVVDLTTLGGTTVKAASAGPALTGEPLWTGAGTAAHLAGTGELIRVTAPAAIEGADVERFPAAPDTSLLVTGPA